VAADMRDAAEKVVKAALAGGKNMSVLVDKIRA
jgi:hypothetical protein